MSADLFQLHFYQFIFHTALVCTVAQGEQTCLWLKLASSKNLSTAGVGNPTFFFQGISYATLYKLQGKQDVTFMKDMSDVYGERSDRRKNCE